MNTKIVKVIQMKYGDIDIKVLCCVNYFLSDTSQEADATCKTVHVSFTSNQLQTKQRSPLSSNATSQSLRGESFQAPPRVVFPT